MRITEVIGKIPFRMALAGGWIDQPFVSRHNPSPPGSMVVISLVPIVRFMDRSGFATGTRRVAHRLWNGVLPRGDPRALVRQLYWEENKDLSDPSGSQDMIGLIYPGISRLDYDYNYEGGIFPRYIKSTGDPETVRWLERIIHLIPVGPRPEGYDPLTRQNLHPEWVRRLGQTGGDCYDAVLKRNIQALGASMNECMRCWEAILPNTVRHPTIQVDLAALLDYYQRRSPGAMYSGCGGGYLLVLSEEPVSGTLKIKVRTA